MPRLGECQCTVLPGNFVCQSQLLETGQGGVSHWSQKKVVSFLTKCEEKLLVDHLKYLASIGYGYNKFRNTVYG